MSHPSADGWLFLILALMKIIFLSCVVFFLLACHQNRPTTCRLVVSMVGTSADSVLLRRISLNNDPSRTIDSGVLLSQKDSLVFELPVSSDSLYQLSFMYASNRVYCIPDNSDIRIVMNKKTGKNSIIGSPVSISLLQFNEEQDSLKRLMYATRLLIKSSGNHRDKQRLDSLEQVVSAMDKNIQQRYYHFADSTSSSAAFMENYDNIEFGKDFTSMKELVTKTSNRFPGSVPIQRLLNQVLQLISIYEKELKTGDVFPELRLPDLEGNICSTSETKGKYLFIDFWSSWCRTCMPYMKLKKELAKDNRFKDLVLISVAMDENLSFCKEIVKINQLKNIQLIDKDVWKGQTASKLAFDSIPFNFLVGPDQRILAKAIPADSMITVLRKYIH
jgi:thiol-disulfide isomerase/thioredoxin